MFKDLFSVSAKDYALYRPTYPPELFIYLSSLCLQRKGVWDAGTGNGQAAVELAKHFDFVIATDPSDQQIKEAPANSKITYKTETAEAPSFTQKVNLITVAQAFHWFKHDQFAEVAKKVSATNGILAAWSYAKATVNTEIDEAVEKLYTGILENYWEKERKLVEEGYKSIELPFDTITAPQFQLNAQWNLTQLLGYFSTWSALNTYLKTHDSSAIEKAFEEIAKAWGDKNQVREVIWPLTLRVWKI